VTVVPVGNGRFAILLLDPAARDECATSRRNDPHGYTEAELRGILANCYRLSLEEIERRMPTESGQTPVDRSEVATPHRRASKSFIGGKSTADV
jgi:hypothetical protein